MIAVRRPDVLVMDLAMPKLDGFGVLDRLLERAETRQIPVVVLTGRELTGAERRLLRERNASVLEKRKYSGDQLRWLVRQALGQAAEPAPVSTRAARPAVGGCLGASRKVRGQIGDIDRRHPSRGDLNARNVPVALVIGLACACGVPHRDRRGRSHTVAVIVCFFGLSGSASTPSRPASPRRRRPR